MNAPLPSRLFAAGALTGPRFRAAGDLTLDLFHHDGRVDAQWLGLTAREFSLLWRLAAAPGERLSAVQLHAEALAPAAAPGDAAIAAHMARLCDKLAAAGLTALLRADAEGCYRLDVPPGSGAGTFAPL